VKEVALLQFLQGRLCNLLCQGRTGQALRLSISGLGGDVPLLTLSAKLFFLPMLNLESWGPHDPEPPSHLLSCNSGWN
jgi:hypothetical protein